MKKDALQKVDSIKRDSVLNDYKNYLANLRSRSQPMRPEERADMPELKNRLLPTLNNRQEKERRYIAENYSWIINSYSDLYTDRVDKAEKEWNASCMEDSELRKKIENILTPAGLTLKDAGFEVEEIDKPNTSKKFDGLVGAGVVQTIERK